MREMKTESWQRFKLSELFEVNNSKKKFNANTVQVHEDSTSGYPYIVRTSENNGRKGFISEDPKYLNPGQSFSFGQDTATVFWQESPYFTGDKVKILLPKRAITTREALFLLAAIRKAFTSFSWGVTSFRQNVIENVEITLPTDAEGEPNWCYMQERIEELEQERIEELEQYLIATGLNDYRLTDEDVTTLSLSRSRSVEIGDNEDAPRLCKEVRLFPVNRIFTKLNLKCKLTNFDKKKDTSTTRTKEFSLPLVNAKHGDNGVQYYGRPEDWESASNTVCVVSNGAIATGDAYPEPQETGVLWDAYLLKPNYPYLDTEILMYLSEALRKSIKQIFSWDNKAVWSKVKNINFALPVQMNQSGMPIFDSEKRYHDDGLVPDWDYMSKYIRAIEKLAIEDVVKYKDAFMSYAKQCV